MRNIFLCFAAMAELVLCAESAFVTDEQYVI